MISPREWEVGDTLILNERPVLTTDSVVSDPLKTLQNPLRGLEARGTLFLP
jgi:hypothetical protein